MYTTTLERSTVCKMAPPQVGAAPDYRLAISGFDAGISSLGDSITGNYNLNGMKFSTR